MFRCLKTACSGDFGWKGWGLVNSKYLGLGGEIKDSMSQPPFQCSRTDSDRAEFVCQTRV
jgi:hypothetical protein